MLRTAYKLSALSRPTITKRMVHAIASKEEFETFTGEGTVLIDFWATWCGPCKAIAPVIDTLETKYETIKFGKVEIDQLGELAQQYDITAVPTFIVFKDGKPVDQIKGANPNNVRAALEQHK